MALPAQSFDKKNLGKASEPPHVKILWLGVNNGMLPAQTFDKKTTYVRPQNRPMSKYCGWW